MVLEDVSKICPVQELLFGNAECCKRSCERGICGSKHSEGTSALEGGHKIRFRESFGQNTMITSC